MYKNIKEHNLNPLKANDWHVMLGYVTECYVSSTCFKE